MGHIATETLRGWFVDRLDTNVIMRDRRGNSHMLFALPIESLKISVRPNQSGASQTLEFRVVSSLALTEEGFNWIVG